MILKCKRCEHVWNYTGNRGYYVGCPLCRTSVKVVTNTNQDIINEILRSTSKNMEVKENGKPTSKEV